MQNFQFERVILTQNCRICESLTRSVYDLGDFYSCGIFILPGSTKPKVGRLKLDICTNCKLVQLSQNYDQTDLYTNSYGYQSAINESMVLHLEKIAYEVNSLLPQNTSLVKHLDIGSNDATLLNAVRSLFLVRAKDQHLNQLGVDPTARAFSENYIASSFIDKIFDEALSKSIGDKFDVITSIAMLYDLPNPKEFLTGIKNLLNENGVWISEQSYFFSMTNKNAFDTICHEHLEYYTLTDINKMCTEVGLCVYDVKFNEVNGGSFRVYIQKITGKYRIQNIVKDTLNNERNRNKELEIVKMFKNVEQIRIELLDFLSKCKERGLEVHGYGASTKGNTLLQYFGIDTDLLPYIAERNVSKFGKLSPGSFIPIISEEESKIRNPYAYLVLPWHFRDMILEREKTFIAKTGTKFCFPLPEFQII